MSLGSKSGRGAAGTTRGALRASDSVGGVSVLSQGSCLSEATALTHVQLESAEAGDMGVRRERPRKCEALGSGVAELLRFMQQLGPMG